MPAQYDLRRGLLVLLGDLDDHVLVQEPPLPQGTPRLGDDVVRGVELAHVLLRESGVHLDLVDHGGDPALLHDPLQVRGLEVADTDGTCASFGVQALQRLPGGDVQIALGQRPVHEVEVDDLQTEPFQ